MRVLVDILHPAHVHFFKNFREVMLGREHDIRITSRVKDVTVDLLDGLGIGHDVLSHQARRPIGLPGELLVRTGRLVRVVREWKPDVLTGIMGPAIALAGRLTNTPSVVFYDTEFATASNSFTFPLATRVCTPDSYQARVRGNHVTYPGYHELAYLHPARFTPDPAIRSALGIHPSEPYSVVRFVSWIASHDIGEVALSTAAKLEVVEHLRSKGRVFVSSESELPAALTSFRLPVPVERIHHVIAGASILVGESATMASEAAVLGIPSVFLSKTSRGYIDDQARRYGLVRHLGTDVSAQDILGAIDEVMGLDGEHWKLQRRALLSDKIDVTDWMVRFFEDAAWTGQRA